MPLITRVSRLFRADLNAVLDRIEEPEVLVRQAIREMEQGCASLERQVQVSRHEQGQLAARISDIDATLGTTQEELEVCFELEKDDLARSLIRCRLAAERQRRSLEHRREVLEQDTAALKQRLEENQARLAGMREKVDLLTEGTFDTAEGQGCEIGQMLRDDEVEVAFLREKQRWSAA